MKRLAIVSIEMLRMNDALQGVLITISNHQLQTHSPKHSFALAAEIVRSIELDD